MTVYRCRRCTKPMYPELHEIAHKDGVPYMHCECPVPADAAEAPKPEWFARAEDDVILGFATKKERDDFAAGHPDRKSVARRIVEVMNLEWEAA